MIQHSYDVIVSKISETAGLSVQEVEEKIKQKLVQLQDLISKEGAAHIVANELDVQLFDNSPKVLKIGSVTAGMNSVTVTGKIVTLYEVRSFNTGTRSGQVANLIMGDETGTIKVVFWDEKLIAEFSKLKEGDILKVKNAYAKQNQNFKEVHLGSKAQILINPEGETIAEVKATVSAPSMTRKKLNDLQPNDFAEVFATIVQIYEPRYYSACPVCNKKVFPQDDKFNCAEHGQVDAKQVPIVNVFIDDGTGNMRAVCFRDQAEVLIGKEQQPFEQIKKSVSGKQLLFKGKVVKNAMFDRTEFMISAIEEPDPERMIAELQQ